MGHSTKIRKPTSQETVLTECSCSEGKCHWVRLDKRNKDEPNILLVSADTVHEGAMLSSTMSNAAAQGLQTISDKCRGTVMCLWLQQKSRTNNNQTNNNNHGHGSASMIQPPIGAILDGQTQSDEVSNFANKTVVEQSQVCNAKNVENF